ncbi:MAG TPA: type II toxin-antitoxin system antitoxin, RelB/DinJ family [Firmicutes bacterium]|nr:type II toxin-antitoxin system antitoxin, RelB/DinJ family [Bacillota bacterium]
MASVNVTIRMDADDKAQAEKLFSELGLTMNAAFNMFAKQSIREQGIPFKATKNAGVQYLDRKTLIEMSEKSDKKYHKAYEELAK